MTSKSYKLSVPISSSNKEDVIISKLKTFADNPTNKLPIKTRLPKTRQSIISIPDYLYFKLKKLYPHYSIESIIYSIFKVKENELFYGSLLFKDVDGWEREKSIPDIGRIDGFNFYLNTIVELKFVKHWTHALGQILAYSLTYPKMKKEVWLLVDKTVKISKERKIRHTLEHYGVGLKFIDINNIV